MKLQRNCTEQASEGNELPHGAHVLGWGGLAAPSEKDRKNSPKSWGAAEHPKKFPIRCCRGKFVDQEPPCSVNTSNVFVHQIQLQWTGNA